MKPTKPYQHQQKIMDALACGAKLMMWPRPRSRINSIALPSVRELNAIVATELAGTNPNVIIFDDIHAFESALAQTSKIKPTST